MFLLKGTVSQEEHFFWRSEHFNQNFLCMRWLFLRCFRRFSLPYTMINFICASLRLLTNYETETLLRIFFSLIGRCSLVPTSHWLQEKCTRIHLSLAAFGMILHNHRRLPVSIFSVKIGALGSLKRVTWRVSKISELKLWVDFFIN